MRLLWYWPFVRPEELGWASEVVRLGNEVVVQTIQREAAPRSGYAQGVDIRADLPDVDRAASGPTWVVSRARTYLGRVRGRAAMLRESEFDVVHYHYLNRFTDPWRRPSGLWVVSVHDIWPHRSRLGPLERPLLARMYRGPDGLIVHHGVLRDQLVEQFGIEPGRIAVVPHQVFPVEAPLLRRVSGAGTPVILFFGALRRNKGLEVLLDAFKMLPSGSVRLHIAGRGDEAIEQLAEDAARQLEGVTAEVGFATPARKAELFRQSSVIALPYTSFESQSGVLHDAYGHWRPVVVSDVGALGATVRADGTGVVVPPLDTKALAAGIERMIGVEGDECGENAQRVARERSPGAAARATCDAYEAFLGTR